MKQPNVLHATELDGISVHEQLIANQIVLIRIARRTVSTKPFDSICGGKLAGITEEGNKEQVQLPHCDNVNDDDVEIQFIAHARNDDVKNTTEASYKGGTLSKERDKNCEVATLFYVNNLSRSSRHPGLFHIKWILFDPCAEISRFAEPDEYSCN